MLDVKFIRDNAKKIQTAANNKNIKINIENLLDIDKKKKELQTKIDELRSRKNQLAKEAGGTKPSKEQIENGKKIKEELNILEDELRKVEHEFNSLMVKVPTPPSPDTPIGKNDSENMEIERWGEPTVFDFKIKDHIQIGKELDIIDFERGVKVAGYRGYYMKNQGAILQMALMMFAMEKLMSKGFVPMIPPTLIKQFALFGSGYFSGQEFDSQVDEIYKIENLDLEADGKINKEGKFLIGTAEPALLAYYSNEILEEKNLPIKICGFSPCYRSEIGSYGKDTKGLYRVHEFMKVEQVCLCPADIDLSEKLHSEMLEISKEIHRDLGIPYRVLQICTGDMSAGKYKMFDLEAWIPSREGWGETGSASNFLDWQARRLNVRYKTKNGEKKFVYMLNNTAIPSPRFIIAILENFQQADGKVLIPKVLKKYFPGQVDFIE